MTAAAIRLFLIDDHVLFREGLLRLLEGDPALTVTGSASSAAEALPLLERAPVDILILDYELGADTALPLVRTLRERRFGGRILLVTAGLPNHDALELLRLGIAGIVHKHQPPAELLSSIRRVSEGKVLFDQQYLQQLVDSAMVPREPAAAFGERDRSILRLLLEGLSNKEIAARLGASESAIKSALQALFAKTGVRTRSQLVRIVLEQMRDTL